MICVECEKLGKKLNTVMHRKEVISILAAEVAMLRTLMDKGGEDKAVTNSVITKCLLALDRETRDKMCELMSRAGGIKISLDSCQHSSGLILV
jgi:hypothetical protein